jgi:two-component system response regulator BaeR
MITPHIYIVEDELDLAHLIADYAKDAGYQTSIFNDGLKAFEQVKCLMPDCIILDLMLPGMDGILFCQKIRAFSQVPIIMCTAKVEEIDRLIGLETGADDYVCKPFSPRELIARIKSIFRRINSQNNIENNLFTIDRNTDRITINGNILPLTKTELIIFSYLLQHPGRIFSRTQLLDYANQDQLEVTERAVDSHIKNLRKKIDVALPNELSNPIHSIYGMGYRYEL